MAVVDIYFDGVLRPVKASSLSIDHQFSLRSTARCVVESPAAAYTPTVGNDFKAYEDGGLIFGGLITSVTRSRIAGTDILVSEIAAVDYSILAAKRLTGERFGSNGYVKQHVNDIFLDLVANCLGGDGIDVSLVTAGAGPIVELAEFDYSTVADAFDRLAELAGRKWRIDFEKKLRLVDPAAPVIFATINDTTQNYLADSLTIEETQEQYVNKLAVRGKRTLLPEVPETFDGSHPDQPTDGTRRDWTLTAPAFSAPTITVDAAAQTVGIAGVDTGKNWYWRPSSAIIEQESTDPVLTAANTLAITYVGEAINQAFAENTGEIAARALVEASSGIWERAVELADPISVADLQQFATSYLGSRDALSKKLVFSTQGMAGIFPGDGIDCNLPGLGNHTYIVTSLGITMLTLGTMTPSTNRQLITRRIEAQFGPILDNGFDYFKALTTASGGAVSASGSVVGGGGGGAPSPWVTIPYASTITPDMTAGSNFQCTLTGNVTVAVPTGGTDGQRFTIWLLQDGTGGRVISLAAGYRTGGIAGHQEANTAVIIDAVMVGTAAARIISINQGL